MTDFAQESYNRLIRWAERPGKFRDRVLRVIQSPLFVIPIGTQTIPLAEEFCLPFSEQAFVSDQSSAPIVFFLSGTPERLDAFCFEMARNGEVMYESRFLGAELVREGDCLRFRRGEYSSDIEGESWEWFCRAHEEAGRSAEAEHRRAFDNQAIVIATACHILCSSSNFVVEEVNVKERERQEKRKNTKLPRYHQRERLFVVSKEECVRKIYRGTSSEGTECEVSPHLRRGHWAQLRHERFGDNRGRRIWRRACWVGPEENTYGNVRYKVRLDL